MLTAASQFDSNAFHPPRRYAWQTDRATLMKWKRKSV
jgi:hypothetical protein